MVPRATRFTSPSRVTDHYRGYAFVMMNPTDPCGVTVEYRGTDTANLSISRAKTLRSADV